jgi:hypothetical protein
VFDVGIEFIPTLIRTIDYEALMWLYLGELLDGDFHELAKKQDVKGIYEAIKYWSIDFEKRERETKDRIRDFLDDLGKAGGVVAVFDPLYQKVILAILETFSV